MGLKLRASSRRFLAVLAFIFAAGLGLSSTASATPEWYFGKVERVYLYSAGFVIRFEGTVLSDCLYNYAYFRDSQLGEKNVDRAYSMAIAAQQSNATFGTVLDIVPGTQCNSNGSADIKFD